MTIYCDAAVLVTPSALLLVLLFVPLLSLLSLLLVLDAEGSRVLEMARVFAVVANYVSARLVSATGTAAPRPAIFVVELERARLAA